MVRYNIAFIYTELVRDTAVVGNEPFCPQRVLKSAPVHCKADRLSTICTSRAKMSAVRTKHDKTTLLVTKGDNGHSRTLRAITYKKILN